MLEEFEQWLNVNKPNSARNYITGYKTLNKLSEELSLTLLDSWTIDNYNENIEILKNTEKFKTLNENGNNMYSATLSNFKKFLDSKILIPPSRPFDEYKWRWASKTPTENLNCRQVLFGVLAVLAKHNKKKHATQEFRDDLIQLENELQSTVSLSKKERDLNKNIIENSGQYWKAYGLLNTTSDGTIDVSKFGLEIIEKGISDEAFVRWQIENFKLPNLNIENKSIIEKHHEAKIEIKPFSLLFNIFKYIVDNSVSDNQKYITVEEIKKIVVPLSVNSEISFDTYIKHIFTYRKKPSEYDAWPNYTPDANDERMLKEYLLFLKNFGAITECASNKGNRYYFNDMTYRLIPQQTTTLNTDIKARNIIYFGSPGTGKSNIVDEVTNGCNVRKVTFHPEYDYNSFVGGYKPSMVGKDIVYKFVPQIFTNIYVEAWNNPEQHYYLQIEEINRGNCAEIFGDLFQLLDRDDDGSSKYDIDASEELVQYLTEEFSDENNGLKNGKIKLPNNLSIVATMNTSDQSLFPMDSAFKRRWDWEYMRIDYNCNQSDFILKFNNGNTYEWLQFLEAVNKLIFEVTDSPDKQIGNWFINATSTNKEIDEKTFVNKVLFYLWNDVFKDEDESLFNIDERTVTYEDFFTENGTNTELIIKIIKENLGLNNKTTVDISSETVELNSEESSTSE